MVLLLNNIFYVLANIYDHTSFAQKKQPLSWVVFSFCPTVGAPGFEPGLNGPKPIVLAVDTTLRSLSP